MDTDIHIGYYLILSTDKGGNLIIKPNKNVDDIKDELLTKPFDEQVYELFEDFFISGWSRVMPEDVDALTAAFIVTDDYTIDDDGMFQVCGNMWSDFPYYTIRSWVEDLFDKGGAVLYKV